MELTTGASSSRASRIQSRIGVLGGTFDPIHNGHVAIATAAFNVLELTSVLFVPAARPWMKEFGTGPGVTSVKHRIEMVKLATESREGFDLSTLDTDLGGLSYSVDTISELREQYGHATELMLILGADALEELPRWREPERLLSMCTLVCIGRPGSGLPENLPDGHPGRDAEFVSGPMLQVNATEIRARIAAGLSVEGMVNASVGAYIEREGLYQEYGSDDEKRH